MDDLLIERQFACKHSLMACVLSFVLFGVGTLGSLCFALTDNRVILIEGLIPIVGLGAALFRWSLFLLVGSGFVYSAVSLWSRIVSLNQRIGLTAKGILMAKKGWFLKEEYVRFSEITELALEEDLDKFGRSYIIGLRFSSPQGNFYVAVEKLAPEAFQEIQQCLLDKVSPEISRQPAVLLLLTAANQLELRGDWDQALALYQQAAERSRGHQDGEYATNCILRIREKKALAKR